MKVMWSEIKLKQRKFIVSFRNKFPLIATVSNYNPV